MQSSIVAVSIKSLFEAERQISGCTNCTDRVTTRFERVVESVTGQPETTKFVLPTLASCPMCHAKITESTLVQLRKNARELLIVNRDDLKPASRRRRHRVQGTASVSDKPASQI